MLFLCNYGHPFPRGLMYIFVSLARLCVAYVVKEVASFRGLGQLMGVVRKITRARAIDQQEDSEGCKTANNCCI